MKHCLKNKGFTLVELMVVVIVIGILVGIAIPVYINSQEKARKVACLQNQKLINNAVVKFSGDKDRYPATVQELVSEGYLESMPYCSGHPYGDIDANGIVQCPDNGRHVLP